MVKMARNPMVKMARTPNEKGGLFSRLELCGGRI
jgi:hypothetical protein